MSNTPANVRCERVLCNGTKGCNPRSQVMTGPPPGAATPHASHGKGTFMADTAAKSTGEVTLAGEALVGLD